MRRAIASVRQGACHAGRNTCQASLPSFSFSPGSGAVLVSGVKSLFNSSKNDAGRTAYADLMKR